MTGDGKTSNEAPIRERAPLGEQSVAFEASKADRKGVLTEKRDNMNRMLKPRPREHKTSETEAPCRQDDATPNRW